MFACFCMRPALPGELYEIFALPGVLYENLALITGHCMEYTLACIWRYYYDDSLEGRFRVQCLPYKDVTELLRSNTVLQGVKPSMWREGRGHYEGECSRGG